MENKQNSLITLPGAIIIAAAIIAIAIIWIKKPVENTSRELLATGSFSETIKLPPVTAEDHIFGNPNAMIKIVEYSDPSCAFCKIFSETMSEIMGEYGPKGNVAWVYRHYPLNQPDSDGNVFHPNSGREAEALECAAKLGGNEKFWAS